MSDLERIENKVDLIFNKLDETKDAIFEVKDRATRIETRMNGHFQLPHNRPCIEFSEHIKQHRNLFHIVLEKTGALIVGLAGGFAAWFVGKFSNF